MDNERPIEKLLRDYAKKRRADAGEPREMHPATRRLLQGEVARQFPKAKRGNSSLIEFFARWRPGLAYGICALVVIAISVPLLLPTFRKAGPESQLAKVAPEEESADKKLQLAAPTPVAAPAVREADEKLPVRGTERPNETAQTALAFADAERAKDDARGLRSDAEKEKSQPVQALASDALVRSAPASVPTAPQVTSLDQSPKRAVEAQRRLEPSGPDSRRMVAEPPSASAGGISLAARSPGVAPPSAAASGVGDSPESAEFRQRYGIPASASAAVAQKSQTANTASFRRSLGTDADASPVLATFQLEQAGDQLRVIDSDGSTYTGAITPPAAGAFYEAKVELKGGPVTKTDDRTAARAISAEGDLAYQPGQNYFFRVTGTNRTLRQPVVFAGNILIPTNVPTTEQAALTQSPLGRSQNQVVPTQNQLPSLLNSTISGNLQLGTNKEMQINALPVKP